MIEVKGLKKGYDKKAVLVDMNLRVQSGAVFGLVGINGAGKSTLLRTLAGVLKADAGEVLFDGEKVYENVAVKREIFFLPDDPYYDTNVTAEGLADLYRAFYEFDEAVFDGFVTEFSLEKNKPIRNFSKGMKRQVFVALALACRPKYLLLDEAFDGLDPLARLIFKRGLIELVEEKGSTVVISSHSLRELEDICDSYAILDGGSITSSGDLNEALAGVCKLQAAFSGEVREEDFDFPCLLFEKTGRVVRIVVKGDREEIVKKVGAMEPIFVEEIDVDFEELFVSEIKNRGYLR
ncbi:MAG: ABC transporter ATP-binding protein [Clostridia bacterium]|nr:ABC transporter ATP-binding protein [Clostridia bacterium]